MSYDSSDSFVWTNTIAAQHNWLYFWVSVSQLVALARSRFFASSIHRSQIKGNLPNKLYSNTKPEHTNSYPQFFVIFFSAQVVSPQKFDLFIFALSSVCFACFLRLLFPCVFWLLDGGFQRSGIEIHWLESRWTRARDIRSRQTIKSSYKQWHWAYNV